VRASQRESALALGPTYDAAETGRNRGVRAARLAAIKTDISANLISEISVESVAARHRVSPRNVQLLFEGEGTTFTAFVQEQRLLCAHRMLISRRFDHRSISDVTFEAGFGDLSWFNRLFRRYFGFSPSDARARSRTNAGPHPTAV
jgi:transcriptional regulator GlxA family with amidase domain